MLVIEDPKLRVSKPWPQIIMGACKGHGAIAIDYYDNSGMLYSVPKGETLH